MKGMEANPFAGTPDTTAEAVSALAWEQRTANLIAYATHLRVIRSNYAAGQIERQIADRLRLLVGADQ